jgi:N-acyl-D-amino-acid deacylase
MTHRNRLVWSIALAFVAAASGVVRMTGQTPAATTLIRRAQMIDGTGAPSRRDDVRIAGDRIVAVGRLTPTEGERVVDANGLTIAPGFIDTHSHHDRGLDIARDALPMVSQGVTTIVVGQDGGGSNLAALFARLESQPVSVNVTSYAGHGSIRSRVMGQDFARHATAGEIERMKPLLKAEMDAGALGLSTGLEYDPGIYSAPEEVLALAKVAADAGGRYISHMRSEDRWFWEALDELIAIGRTHRMPVQVSHMKLGMHDLWGQADKLIGVLDRARADGVQLTADIYPYAYWQSNLGVLYPKRNFSDEKETEFADLVLFDAAVVADRADFGTAQAQAVGVRTVWVNGQMVFQDGQTTAVYSGRPLRRENTPWPAAARDARRRPRAPALAFDREPAL